METLKNLFYAVLFITLFSSCQSGGDVTQVLSKPESRKVIMDSIANNSEMSQEMMETILEQQKRRSNVPWKW